MSYSRFAIYYLPPDGALADFGAQWLGWDVVRGCETVQADVPGLHDITMTPRKYGFHGTLKPPFRLAEEATAEALTKAVATMAGSLHAPRCEGLSLTTLGGFLALTPRGDVSSLRALAAACVTRLDDFRAPASEAEMARRRAAGLTRRQETHLTDWGYPYVLDEFRFHMTLSGRLPPEDVMVWIDRAAAHLPPLPTPFVFDQIALCGERADGRFELIHRYTLAG